MITTLKIHEIKVNERKEEKSSENLLKKKKIDFLQNYSNSKNNVEKLTTKIDSDTIIHTIKSIENNEKNHLKAELKIVPESIENIRSQLLDWLIVVVDMTNQRDETFYLSIEILDKILYIYDYDLSDTDCHLLLLASFFIASKYTEIKSISIDTIENQIGHGKFTKEEIISTELLILSKLHFKIPKNNFIDFVNILFNENINDENKMNIQNSKFSKLFLQFAKTFYKMILIQPIYEFNNNILTYSGIIYYSFLEATKIINIENNFLNGKFWQILQNFKIFPKEIFIFGKNLKKTKCLIEAENTNFPYFKKFGFSNIIKNEALNDY